MKRQLAIALGLAVVSTSALASKARLESLGQDANGSQYLDDNRSVFLNASYLNQHKDFVTMEWGDTKTVSDSAKTPRAEGGAFKSSGNMVYGLYFGEENNDLNTLKNSLSLSTETNSTTVFVGGDAGVQWGASLNHATLDDKTNSEKASALAARLGVISGNIEAFANIGLTNTAEKGTKEIKGKSSYDLGVTYNMGDVNYMIRAKATNVDADSGTGAKSIKTSSTSVGASKLYKLNDKANMWASAFYTMTNDENKLSGTKEKLTYLPVLIALEVSAKDWLTLRGSVGQNVLVGTKDDGTNKDTIKDSTFVNAGASLIFGDLTVDGMIGNNTGAAPTAADSGADSSTANGNGTLRTDSLMSRVSMTYNF